MWVGIRRLASVTLLAATVSLAGPPSASAAEYLQGPLGTNVELGNIACKSTQDRFGFTKTLRIETPAIYALKGLPLRFQGIKLTIAWYSLANGAASWVRQTDILAWARHDLLASEHVWTFGSGVISKPINVKFAGAIAAYQYLQFTDSAGRTVQGGTFGWHSMASATEIYRFPDINYSANGACLF